MSTLLKHFSLMTFSFLNTQCVIDFIFSWTYCISIILNEQNAVNIKIFNIILQYSGQYPVIFLILQECLRCLTAQYNSVYWYGKNERIRRQWVAFKWQSSSFLISNHSWHLRFYGLYPFPFYLVRKMKKARLGSQCIRLKENS